MLESLDDAGVGQLVPNAGHIRMFLVEVEPFEPSTILSSKKSTQSLFCFPKTTILFQTTNFNMWKNTAIFRGPRGYGSVQLPHPRSIWMTTHVDFRGKNKNTNKGYIRKVLFQFIPQRSLHSKPRHFALSTKPLLSFTCCLRGFSFPSLHQKVLGKDSLFNM